MRRITGRVQHYAWGSPTAIPELLSLPQTGQPHAEYWLGAHPSAPSAVEDEPFDVLIERDPSVLGASVTGRYGARLPYLMKVLAADQPLSLQAHPNRRQAEAGYAREEAAGLAPDARERSYKDDWPKPETIIALTPFHGLCGFRDPAQTHRLFEALGTPIPSVIGPLLQRRGPAAVAEVFVDVLSLGDDRAHLVGEVLEAARTHASDEGEVGDFARTALEIEQHFPADPGILAALLLNRFELQPGEGLYLPPGNMHAYLGGVGVEVMANSDNVLRGGLTTKHIDVEQLLEVVDFSPHPVVPMAVTDLGKGVHRYRTDAPEFAVWSLDLSATEAPLPGQGARILLVTEGYAEATSQDGSVRLERGQAALAVDGEQVTVIGAGRAFLAGAGGQDD